MVTRRIVAGALALGALCIGTLCLTAPAVAQSYKDTYKELFFAVVPAENASGVVERWTPFADYLSKELGVKVTIKVANDYAAVIEGQRAGNIQIANYGAASFARALITGVKTEAFATDLDKQGSTGYYSVFYVLKDSPYQKIEDLKGKNLALVDVNSTSGNNVTRFELNKKGIDPETFFGKVIYAGSHDNACLALAQGQVDVAANAWTNDKDSYLYRLVNKGQLRKADGTLMKVEDFRIIGTSAPILNGPYTYLEELPDDLKAAIRRAFADAPTKAKDAFDKLYDGAMASFTSIKTEDYMPTVELVKFVDALKKKKS